jgi:UDP-N-acetylmuramoyl-tripeptide--D-alanyl-D-alanine ligase
MLPWTLEEVSALTNGLLVNGKKETLITGVVHDTRDVKKGDLFVAIVGERLDGHQFLKQAAAKGAAAVMVSKVISGIKIPQIKVENTTKALGELGKAQRLQWGGLVVAVTGSVGKTTVKDMAAHLVSGLVRTLKTQGNLNNQFGLPLTLLRLTQKDEVAVVEIGINHPGEMEMLSDIARPDVAMVTAIGEAHLGFFKGKAELAREKMKIAHSLREGGIRILNGDDRFLKAKGEGIVSYGLKTGQVKAKNLRSTAHGTSFTLKNKGKKAGTELRMLGLHNVQNALAAVAAGLVLGMPLKILAGRLKTFKPQARMRMETKKVKGVLFVNDAYNASPTSMEAALETFKALKGKGRKAAVLGDMLEMGAYAKEAHRRMVKLALSMPIEDLILVGKNMKEAGTALLGKDPLKARMFDKAEDAAVYLKGWVRQGDSVLLKASRGIRLEKILEAF